MFKKYFSIILGLLFVNTIFSQSYEPIDTTDGDWRNETIDRYKNLRTQFLKDISLSQTGKRKKLLVQNFNSFDERFSEQIKKGQFLHDNEIQNFTENVIEELTTKNPDLPQDFHVLISKDISLNSFCLLDGTLVVNLGLFYFLENEDQIAAVLSHEISHKVLKHSLKSQLRRIETELSDQKKKKVKNLRKQRYNRSQTALNLFREEIYQEGIASRYNEIQADSLGYELFKSTKYDSKNYLAAIRLMEKYDTLKPEGLRQKAYKKWFDLPEQAFNEKWLEKEDFSSYDYSKFKEKINQDSIATHPDVSSRIETLVSYYPELKNKPFIKKSSELYTALQYKAWRERVPMLYNREVYGGAIYLCLLNLEDDDLTEQEQKFFRQWLGLSFQKVFEARENYKLNQYLDRVNPKDQSESYQQFLNFMWNLSLKEMNKIAEFYTTK